MGKNKDRFFKFYFQGIIGLMFIIGIASSGIAETGQDPNNRGNHEGRLIIMNNKISADFDEASLREVFVGIKDQSNIWFKGNESLLEGKISVRFTDLSVEEGIKRVLRFANYVLVYNDNGELAGVMLFNRLNTKEKETSKNIPYLTESSSEPDLQEDKVKDPLIKEALSSSRRQNIRQPMPAAIPDIRLVKESEIAQIVSPKIHKRFLTFKTVNGKSTSALGRALDIENIRDE